MPIQIVGDDRNKPAFSITAAFHTLVSLLFTIGGTWLLILGLVSVFSSTLADELVALMILLVGVTSLGLGLIISFLKRIAESLES